MLTLAFCSGFMLLPMKMLEWVHPPMFRRLTVPAQDLDRFSDTLKSSLVGLPALQSHLKALYGAQGKLIEYSGERDR
jgi:hypothetical protein